MQTYTKLQSGFGRTKPRVFISFDFDHDEDLRNLLVGQSRNEDTPFDLIDWSVKEHMTGDWKEKVRVRLRQVDQVIVICGLKTDVAAGVSAEMRIAREEGKPYFLLAGRSHRNCAKPGAAFPTDKMYEWTWANLELLIKGHR